MLKTFLLYISLLLCFFSCKETYSFGECIQKPDETKIWKVLSDGQVELQNGETKGEISALKGSGWVKTTCPTI